MDDPLAPFNAEIIAINDEQWLTAAQYCDPVSLRRFKREQLDHVATIQPPGDVIAEQWMKHDPGMPREVAEYHARQHRRFSTPEFLLENAFPTHASLEALTALGPAELFAAWLEGQSPRWQVKRMIARGLAPPEMAEHVNDMHSHIYRYVVIGAMTEGESTAYVLYRDDPGGESAMWSGEAGEQLRMIPEDEQALVKGLAGRGHPRTALCRKQADGSWKFIASHDFLGAGSRTIASVSMGGTNTVIEHTEICEESRVE